LIALLDTNVLIALSWPNHVHHEIALKWFTKHQRHGWATCPMTQSGFVRVSSNRAVIPEARSPGESAALLREILALPHHHFWADDISLAASEFVEMSRVVGFRQVTDAHLLALALRHGGCLATLDRDLRALVPSGYQADRVVVDLTEKW
jgi:toxin-antitoxin system PIN domain toxin